MPTEGEQIGSYQLTRKLGEGAFGEVWLVHHVDLGVDRAMKIPTQPDYVRQLRHEGRAQFTIEHPNIVRTVDLNTSSDPPYFVMEYVEGQTLRQRLDEAGKLPPPQALGILDRVLDGLAAAHAQGLVHRDLKPENILIAADGTPKITDFGLGRIAADVARAFEVDSSLISLEADTVSGTLAYMSPEQRDGGAPDPRDDVYALGVVACELLTGGRPSQLGAAKPLRREGVPADVIAFIEHALEEPDARYPDAGAMLAALRAAGRDQQAPVLQAVADIQPVEQPRVLRAPRLATAPAAPGRGRGPRAWGLAAGLITLILVIAYAVYVEGELSDWNDRYQRAAVQYQQASALWRQQAQYNRMMGFPVPPPPAEPAVPAPVEDLVWSALGLVVLAAPGWVGFAIALGRSRRRRAAIAAPPPPAHSIQGGPPPLPPPRP